MITEVVDSCYEWRTIEEETSTYPDCFLDTMFREKQFIFLILPFKFEVSLAVGLEFEELEEVDFFFSLLSR